MLFSLSGIFSNPVDRMMEYDLKTLWTGPGQACRRRFEKVRVSLKNQSRGLEICAQVEYHKSGC
jgi:hypothetical protein